ncbi:ribosomal RNA adenine dimethylase-domain-containing protein [Absidia repens]|uniref:rRNA adenine N(6)-methyltransferase n=1 Tax=Absidia repens TaxID=90262 RepID=A0A1X2IEB0_9FUNG|nr:ribosomal RNA adenine dimethylase-domain-containing protein [Absidia repens]
MSSIRSLVPKVPALSAWSKKFRNKGAARTPRCTLADQVAADTGFEKLRQHTRWSDAAMDNMTVVEINPGLGVWTSALFNGGFNKIYSLEPNVNYLHEIQALADESDGSIIPLKKDGYDWKTYVELKDNTYLGKYINPDWSKVHPNILFTGTLPKSAKGEQLLAQFATCIVNKMALHSIGRIQMALWIPDQLYQKFTAAAGSKERCKMGVVSEACADINLIYSPSPESVYLNNSYHLVHIVPNNKANIKAEWDVFEYVLKHIFVMQKQPLNKMVRTLGPGADIILGRLSFDSNILVGNMSASQIDEVAIKFDQWPLRPKVLFEDSQTAI